jgi:class 3 adenylate cyclase
MITCAHCSFTNPDDASFCENCGQPLPRSCPQCGQPVTQGARFCKRCGVRLGEAAETAAPAAQPAPSLPVEPPGTGLAGGGVPVPVKTSVGRAEAGRAEAGERKLVTALFTDIVGSTSLAERMDPEDWREVVTGAHQIVSEAVYKYGGMVAQLLGDGVLAFFGAPVAHEDDAERAVRAALETQAGIRDYAGQLHARGQVEQFQMRVGLNSGLVVVGNVGSDRHTEYLAVGDTVNLAARMQSAAEPDSVLMSENTFRQVSTLFEYEDRGRIEVKGKAEPVGAYRVIGERRGARRERGVAGLRAGLVGRQRELALLQDAIVDLQAGEGRIVTIVGEAGVGKSRLVAEWRRDALAAGPSGWLRWSEGRCLSYGTGMAYHLIADTLRALCGIPRDASSEAADAAARQITREVLGAEYAAIYPFLSQLMGLRLDDEMAARVRYLEGPALQRQYVVAFRRFLQVLAARTPVVVVCDDIHWADPSSVELLGQALPMAGTARIIFALLTRPDRDAPGWQLVTRAQAEAAARPLQIDLAPLSETDSRALVGQLLQMDTLPESLRRLVLGKSEGNPFFVEEVVRMLIDEGTLVRDATVGGWRLTSAAADTATAIAIPDTLQGILSARIDRLPEEEKWLLQIASVIGRQFPVSVLEQVVRRQGGL